MNDKIPYNSLRKILLDLGFVEQVVPGKHALFEHAPSGTILVYRIYRPAENITWSDHVKTRRFLDENGILDADLFEARLQQTPVGSGGNGG
jgi:predicted RNA binding protein YcfA (HicA-like mRNA interferase family)